MVYKYYLSIWITQQDTYHQKYFLIAAADDYVVVVDFICFVCEGGRNKEGKW
jgi:hypothetical protein